MSDDWRADVPRASDAYHLSDHAFIRAKERGITRDLIGEVIAEGALQEAKGGYPHVRFLHDPGYADPVGLVAHVADGRIETVYWNYMYDHPGLDAESPGPTTRGSHHP